MNTLAAAQEAVIAAAATHDALVIQPDATPESIRAAFNKYMEACAARDAIEIAGLPVTEAVEITEITTMAGEIVALDRITCTFIKNGQQVIRTMDHGDETLQVSVETAGIVRLMFNAMAEEAEAEKADMGAKATRLAELTARTEIISPTMQIIHADAVPARPVFQVLTLPEMTDRGDILQAAITPNMLFASKTGALRWITEQINGERSEYRESGDTDASDITPEWTRSVSEVRTDTDGELYLRVYDEVTDLTFCVYEMTVN